MTGRSRSVEDWKWQWVDNPAGRSEMWLIEETLDDGSARLIGHHGVMPFRATIDGNDCLVGKTENTMVHPDHRSRILYPRFERRFLAAYEPRFAMLFSTTGPAAAIRLRKAMGYEYRDPMWIDLMRRGFGSVIDLLRARRARERSRGSKGHVGTPLETGRFRNASVVPVDDQGFLSKWSVGLSASDASAGDLRLDRSPEVLVWRYGNHPSGVYRAICGAGFLAVVHVRHERILCVNEIASTDGDPTRAWEGIGRLASVLGFRVLQIVGSGHGVDHIGGLGRGGWSRLRRTPCGDPHDSIGMPCLVTAHGAGLGIDFGRSDLGPLVFEGPGRN